jgi:serine/threonine protein kinase
VYWNILKLTFRHWKALARLAGRLQFSHFADMIATVVDGGFTTLRLEEIMKSLELPKGQPEAMEVDEGASVQLLTAFSASAKPISKKRERDSEAASDGGSDAGPTASHAPDAVMSDADGRPHAQSRQAEHEGEEEKDEAQSAAADSEPKQKKQRMSSKEAMKMVNTQKHLERNLLEHISQQANEIAKLKEHSFPVRMRECQPFVEGGCVGLGDAYEGLGVKSVKRICYKILFSRVGSPPANDPYTAEIRAWNIIRQAQGKAGHTLAPYRVNLPFCYGPALVSPAAAKQAIVSHSAAIAMEWIPGCSLEDLDSTTPGRDTQLCRLSLHQRIKIAMQIVHAVQYVRSLKLVHRDIHPGNVMVTSAQLFRECFPENRFVKDSQSDETDRALYMLGVHNGPGYKNAQYLSPSEEVREFRVVLTDFDLSRSLPQSEHASETFEVARTWRGGVQEYQAAAYWGEPPVAAEATEANNTAEAYWSRYDDDGLVLTILGVLQGCLLQPILERTVPQEDSTDTQEDGTGTQEGRPDTQKDIDESLANMRTAVTDHYTQKGTPAEGQSLFAFFIEADLNSKLWHQTNPNRFAAANQALRRWMTVSPDLHRVLCALSCKVASKDPPSTSLQELEGELRKLLKETTMEKVAIKLREKYSLDSVEGQLVLEHLDELEAHCVNEEKAEDSLSCDQSRKRPITEQAIKHLAAKHNVTITVISTDHGSHVADIDFTTDVGNKKLVLLHHKGDWLMASPVAAADATNPMEE